ncbi:MAG: FecR domain-containing protein [Pseudomonadota bacterium]
MSSATAKDPALRDDGIILREAHTWRLRLTEEDVTPEERKAFESWRHENPRHSDLYERAVTFTHAMGELTASDLPDDVLRLSMREQLRFSIIRAWEAIFERLKVPPWALAAMVTLVIAGGLFFRTSVFQSEVPSSGPTPFTADLSTGIGEVRTFELPDESRVTLGAASEASIEFDAKRRAATLKQGTGFFDVASDAKRAFAVRAGRLNATVIGTRFDVRMGGDVVRVAVAEGQVRVAYPLVLSTGPTNVATQQLVGAGEKVEASSAAGLTDVSAINPSAVGSWRNATLYYDGAPLTELLEDANRYTKADVVYDGAPSAIADLRVRGSFKATDIDGMLSTLSEIYPLSVDRSVPGTIRITPRATSP